MSDIPSVSIFLSPGVFLEGGGLITIYISSHSTPEFIECIHTI